MSYPSESISNELAPRRQPPINPLRKQMHNWVAQQRYSEALACGQQLLSYTFPPAVKPREHVEVLQEVAGLCHELGYYAQAAAYQQQAVTQLQLLESVAEVELVEARFGLGIAHAQARAMGQALPLLEQHSTYWQQRLEGSLASIAAYHLARSYYQIGKLHQRGKAYDQASSYANLALQLLRKIGTTERELLPHVYLLRGKASQGLGHYAEAIAYKRQARELWEAPVWPGYPSSCVVITEQEPNLNCLSKVYLSLAASYRSIGDWPRALAYQRWVVRLWTTWAPHHPVGYHWVTLAYRELSLTYRKRQLYLLAWTYQFLCYWRRKWSKLQRWWQGTRTLTQAT